MEAHHPHHLTHKKKWTEYLLEFFMLFFAVFLGFVAENIRENIADRGKAKSYLKSFYEDVKKDTANLSTAIKWFEEAVKDQDSLIRHFNDIKEEKFPVHFFNHLHSITYFEDFVYTDRTIQQLKNAGGLRLIEDKAIADSIIEYDAAIRYQMTQVEAIVQGIYKLIDIEDNLLNKKQISEVSTVNHGNDIASQNGNWLLSRDEAALGNFYNKIVTYHAYCSVYLKRLIISKDRGIRLLHFFKSKYDFE